MARDDRSQIRDPHPLHVEESFLFLFLPVVIRLNGLEIEFNRSKYLS